MPSADEQFARVAWCLKHWEGEGRAELVKTTDEVLHQLSDEPSTSLTALLHALVSRAVHNDEELARVQELLQTILTENSLSVEQRCNLVDTIVDVVWENDVALQDTHDHWAARVSVDKATPAVISVEDNKRERLKKVAHFLAYGSAGGDGHQFIPKHLLIERWETTLLAELGLIPDRAAFEKKLIRTNTALLYKQQKFNLLREESEGYSKLLSGVATQAAQYQRVDGVNDGITRAIQNMQSLIGYFDLDPNRVLDLILDAFIANVDNQHEFFLRLLEASPWAKRDTSSTSSQHTNQMFPSVDNHAFASKEGVFAQILAFKFKFYQREENFGDEPSGLFLVTALLISKDYLSILDIYESLAPNETELESEQGEWRKSLLDKAKTSGGGLLASYAPLGDDPRESSKVIANADVPEPARDAQPAKRRTNQKMEILKAFLLLGDLPNAMFFLYKQSEYTGSEPDVAILLCRIVHAMLEPVYIAYCSNRDEANDKSKSDQSYFQYEGWSDRIISCHTFEDIQTYAFPILRLLGCRIYHDMPLYSRLCRIGNAALRQDLGNTKAVWNTILRQNLIPAISLVYANPGMIHELWTILEHFPYTERYALYGEWDVDMYRKIPELKLAKAEAEKEVKGAMRRLAKENVKQLGRHLAKICHSNPLVGFSIMLDQVQGYDNLVSPVVDACKYLTQFGYDVLTYVIIAKLTGDQGPGKRAKSRLKEDGITHSDWLQALSSFCGTLFRKYPMMDCGPLLQYLVNQLVDRSTEDLIILRELVNKMSGIEVLSHYSGAQIEAMAGGSLLRTESLSSDANDRAKGYKRSATRLMKSLQDNNLAFPLLVLIAQQREMCIFKDSLSQVRHLKLLGNMFDECHTVMLQYIEFLNNFMEEASYIEMLPTLTTLHQSYGLPMEICHHFLRPRNILALRKSSQALAGDSAAVDKPKVIDEHEASSAQSEYQEAIASPQTMSQNEIRDLLPHNVWDALSPSFYTLFWSLDLYDIHVPRERYAAEIAKLQHTLQQLQDDWSELAKGLNPSNRKRLLERTNVALVSLQRELNAQEENHRNVLAKLQAEKSKWFTDASSRGDIAAEFIQHCLHPRSMISAKDAIFCARMIQLMHSMGTENFSSLTLYDKLLAEYVNAEIYLRTEAEAAIYGHFLSEILWNLTKWHRSSDLYQQEGKGGQKILPGFQKKWNVGANSKQNTVLADSHLLQYNEYRQVMWKWHCKLNAIFDATLTSGQHLRMRNSIIVLTRIEHSFPLVRQIGDKILTRINEIIDTESKQDLKVLARGYKAVLDKNKPKWVEISEFYDYKARVVPSTENTQSSTADDVRKERDEKDDVPNSSQAPDAKQMSEFKRDEERVIDSRLQDDKEEPKGETSIGENSSINEQTAGMDVDSVRTPGQTPKAGLSRSSSPRSSSADIITPVAESPNIEDRESNKKRRIPESIDQAPDTTDTSNAKRARKEDAEGKEDAEDKQMANEDKPPSGPRAERTEDKKETDGKRRSDSRTSSYHDRGSRNAREERDVDAWSRRDGREHTHRRDDDRDRAHGDRRDRRYRDDRSYRDERRPRDERAYRRR